MRSLPMAVAVLRMCPMVASVILLQHGIEPICQTACRDRNRIGLQADLMGAHALASAIS